MGLGGRPFAVEATMRRGLAVWRRDAIRTRQRDLSLAQGAGVCCLFAVLAIAVRGVRWDESWEHAQILAGQVQYPAGHPLSVYVRGAFSAQSVIGGALVRAGVGPELFCGFRNALFLLSTILPAYLLTAVLTRNTLWGLVGALFVLEGIFLEFDGSYPTAAWPELFSNGPIGGGFALVAFWALLAGHHRSAGILFGVMPAIHVGQWPPLIVFFGLYATMLARKRQTLELVRLSAGACAGITISAVFYLVQRSFVEALPHDGPFLSADGPTPIWEGFTALHDPHRRFPPVMGHIMIVGTLLLGFVTMTASPEARKRAEPCSSPVKWLALYAGIVAGVVWGTMIVHWWLSSEIPFLVIAWMPYRLINHLAPICIAFIIAVLCRERPGRFLLLAVLIFCAAHPLLSLMFPDEMYTRYVQHGEFAAFGLAGAAIASALASQRLAIRLGVLVALAAMIGIVHQFGAACFIAGAISGIALRPNTNASRALLWPVGAVVVASATLLLAAQFQTRSSLPTTDFDRELQSIVPPDSMLLPPPNEFLLQARTNRPVLVDAALPSLISYMPQLGPGIEKLFNDVYGQSFQIDGHYPDWRIAWKGRSRAEWSALAQNYGFDYVIAPNPVTVDLTPALRGDRRTLFTVEGASP